MINITQINAFGWEAAVRGMRNPLNSWHLSDSAPKYNSDAQLYFDIGPKDLKLMHNLVKSGSDHAKFRRMINVTMDITAPLYWWKEFDTYKVGTVANSCSTMHTIHKQPFSSSDFSLDMLMWGNTDKEPSLKAHYKHFMNVVSSLNNLRDLYLETKDKKYWRAMIEMLPSSFNQRRTVQLNYEVLANIYKSRKTHKLDEWITFCNAMKTLLPHSELFTLEGLDGETELS